ncbi:endonuclease/exonuclease/phosphatase family protein [Jannaschia formosa]|uniref:endonuclease/exonuclease/phosphatase family protein n=1 Tax=Jannaschia formosa TaxID=2259592 RepID=UPI000E1BC716|nr:endonuclease/exonuclease/phosphatase family protein [Jannaschia formosa]TFL18373.1 endonuclease [Jannaschia formosa]
MQDRPALACATWNVHRAVDMAGRRVPDRCLDAIAEVVMPQGPRVLALQEADSDDPPHEALLDPARLSAITGLRSVHDGDDMRWTREGGGFLGNVLMLDPAIELRTRRIVDLPGAVPRAAVLAETVTDGAPLRIVSCHLSLLQALRAVQLRTLGQVIARAPAMQTILLGDLNEWRPWGGLALSRRMTGLALSGPARRTFPSRRPLLPLDRILTDRGGRVEGLRVLSVAGWRDVSDHLPLIGRVTRGAAS